MTTNYPLADTRTQWFQGRYPGAPMFLSSKTAVLCIHTTEGTGWPSYGGGATAPTYTYMPAKQVKGSGAWRAHFPDNRSARALRNLPGGVETNTMNVIQVELIGTCDPKHAKSWNGQGKLRAGVHYVYWPNAAKHHLDALAHFIADLNKRHGLQLVAPRKFIAYPGSYGNTSVRLSGAQWRQTVGVVGHQHIPENSHGDPGNIDIDYVLKRAKALTKPAKPAKPKVKRSRLVTLHASMQFSDPTKQKAHDVQAIFAHAVKKKASWITGTEAAGSASADLRKLLREHAAKNGYRFWMHAGQDTWIAVRRSLIAGGWQTHYTPVIPGKAGVHSGKGVHYVSFKTKNLGRITVFSGHWLTKGDPARVKTRLSDNRRLADATSAAAIRQGKGKKLVFYGGDQNILGGKNRKGQQFLGREPFLSCWDEKGKWPKTHVSGNIDVIARSKRDGRVKCVRARRFTDKKLFLHTDHLLVQAVYDVRHVKKG